MAFFGRNWKEDLERDRVEYIKETGHPDIKYTTKDVVQAQINILKEHTKCPQGHKRPDIIKKIEYLERQLKRSR